MCVLFALGLLVAGAVGLVLADWYLRRRFATRYCQERAQEIQAQDELARQTYAREREERGDLAGGDNEYAQAVSQDEQACRQLLARDRKFSNMLFLAALKSALRHRPTSKAAEG